MGGGNFVDSKPSDLRDEDRLLQIYNHILFGLRRRNGSVWVGYRGLMRRYRGRKIRTRDRDP